MNIGIKIKNLRQKTGMKISELAKASGLSISMISQLERNIITPSISTLITLAEIFGVKPSYFLEEDPPQELIIKKTLQAQFINEVISPSDGIPVYLYEIELNEGETKKISLKKLSNYSAIYFLASGSIEIKNEKNYILKCGEALYLRKNYPEFKLNSKEKSKLIIFIFKTNNV